MNACLFITTITMMVPVWGNDRVTQINTLNPGDQICVLEIQGNWMATHWSRGAQGHGGWLKNVNVQKTAQPTEPTYQEN